jgi:hypothetical protein
MKFSTLSSLLVHVPVSLRRHTFITSGGVH